MNDYAVLTLSIWAVISFLMVKTVEVYVTLLLIGLLVVMEVGDVFINPEIKRALKPVVYLFLFIFFIIVVRKIMEVLS